MLNNIFMRTLFILFTIVYLIQSCAPPVVKKTKVVDIYSHVKDVDKNEYKAIRIGNQTWFVENLTSSQFSYTNKNGSHSPIRTLEKYDSSLVNHIALPFDTLAYQFAYDGLDTNASNFGRMYTWMAATDPKNACPTGWHLPSDNEWQTLITYLDGEEVAGGKLKDTSRLYWELPNVDAQNSVLFSARAGGYRTEFGSYINLKKFAFYWSATEDPDDSKSAIVYAIHSGSGKIYRTSKPKRYAMSIKCVLN